MTKKFKYSKSFSPPAPVLPAKLENPSSGLTVELDGKLDTGADITVIPDSAVQKLDLPPRGTIRIKDDKERPLYFTNIKIATHNFERVMVTSLQKEYILVGRDILNQLKILLDGKKLEFEIVE